MRAGRDCVVHDVSAAAVDGLAKEGAPERSPERQGAPAPGPAGPPDRHARDAVIVTFTKLKPRVTFVERGTVHNDEQTSGADRGFAFEMK